MTINKKVALVNKCYWPDGTLIGDALLEVTKKLLKKNEVIVIGQTNKDLSNLLPAKIRSNESKLIFKMCKPKSNRKSSLVLRAFDALFFMNHVLLSLLITRPSRIYVSTNPPIFVPFIVFLYCNFSNSQYIYHVQDIHPEAARLIAPINGVVYRFLCYLDSISLRNASLIVTLTEEMKTSIRCREGEFPPIRLLRNPANSTEVNKSVKKIENQVVYTGGLGRFQNISLLIDSIEFYLELGGKLSFSFCGDGVYAAKLLALSKKYSSVEYLGLIRPSEAALLVSKHNWALLPIDDRVTKYAFPCKTSTYLVSGCNILAISSKGEAVANWVIENKVGFAVEPTVKDIVAGFIKLEGCVNKPLDLSSFKFKSSLSMKSFSDSIIQLFNELDDSKN